VDLAAVRADGVSETTEETSDAPGSGGALLLVVTAIVLLALVATAVLLGKRDHDHRQSAGVQLTATPTEEAALAAARGEAVALTTIGYLSAASDLNRVLAGSTGALHTQFEKEKSQLPATLAKTKSDSRGAVLSAALSSLAGTKAQALVAVDATVSGTDTSGSGVLKHYRMVVTLQQVAGKWLASDVAFAGVPQ
jgi:Mce-associated membrane protein